MFFNLLLWVFIFALIFILLKFLNIKKNYLISFAITLFIIIFAINLEISIASAIVGAKLVLNAILPTIFPFSVICNLLICYDGIGLYSKLLGPLICKPLGLSKNCSFPLIASFICGYPLGAKYSSDLYELGFIHKDEYERLLNIASNAGPIFVLGSVGIAMFYSIQIGYILLIANYLSIFIIGFMTKKDSYYKNNDIKVKSEFNDLPFGTNLKNSIDQAISTTINVSAFVIMFSVFINIIKSSNFIITAFINIENFFNFPSGILYNLLLGSIEFTNGCKLISLSSMPINLKLSIASFILSFSSLSVIAQVSSVTSKTNPNMRRYIAFKFIQGLISFFITFICSSLIPISTTTANLNLNLYNLNLIQKPYIFILSFLLFTLLICIGLRKVKKLHLS